MVAHLLEVNVLIGVALTSVLQPLLHRGGSYFRPAATPNRSGPDYIYRHRHQVRGGDNFDHHGKMGHDTTSAPRGGIRN